MTRPSRLLILLSVAGIFGCDDPTPQNGRQGRNEGWSQVRLPKVSRQAAFEAGEHAMKQWFKVAEALPSQGQIRSAAQEFDQRGGTERIRDAAIKYKNSMRRTATLVVLEDGDGCIARCGVEVQRLDTADHRVFRDNSRFTDYPNQTPIDTDAGVSASQDQVWTDLPHDRQLEQDILRVLQSRLAVAATAAPAGKP